MEVVNLNEKLSKITEHWSPKIVGEVNESYVKVVKLKALSSGITTMTRTKCSSS